MNILKFIFVVFFPFYSIQTGYSQEKSHFKCAYKLDYVRDTMELKYFRQETYIVQIGDKMTKGFTYQKYYNDSLKTNAPHLYKKLFKASMEESIEAMRRTGDISHANNNAFSSGAFASDVYKDYTKNEIRVRDNISTHSFVYTDELKSQDWAILNETSTISGYASQKAICHFRGRDWVAWFAPEIPLSEGPWKFFGLPGLITKIHDSKNHYSFELIGFQKVEEIIDAKIPRTAQKVDRKEFIRAKMGAKGATISESDMVQVGLSSSGSQQKKLYDYIERDYK